MRKPKISDLEDINTGQLILFTRPQKDGTPVLQIGFVNDVIENDDNTVNTVQVMPLIESKDAPKIPSETFEITERTAQYCGLDTPHLVLPMGINIPASDFPNAKVQKIGFINERIANQIHDLADKVANLKPNFFQLSPSFLGKITLPHHKPESLTSRFSAPTPSRAEPSNDAAPKSGTSLWRAPRPNGHSPDDAWDIDGKDMSVPDLPEARLA